MQRELSLVWKAKRDDWRLDEHTRDVGRKGLADARQALEDARKRAAA